MVPRTERIAAASIRPAARAPVTRRSSTSLRLPRALAPAWARNQSRLSSPNVTDTARLMFIRYHMISSRGSGFGIRGLEGRLTGNRRGASLKSCGGLPAVRLHDAQVLRKVDPAPRLQQRLPEVADVLEATAYGVEAELLNPAALIDFLPGHRRRHRRAR